MTVTINGTTGIANDGGYTGDGVVFADTTPANTLVTTTGGNVGIGTSSPSGKLSTAVSDGSTVAFYAERTGGSPSSLSFTFANAYANLLSSGVMAFHTAGTQRAMIDSSGNLLVGTTTISLSSTVNGFVVNANGTVNAYKSGGVVAYFNRNTSDGTIVSFRTSDVERGSVSISGATTSYNTSSDYRLKENIQPMTGALAKVAQLKPVTYKWKADGYDGEGFIAHELAEVVPQCVTGEKDAVDAEGKPVYQGIDTSFLVATLTAAIQELKAIVDAQGAEIAALKGTA